MGLWLNGIYIFQTSGHCNDPECVLCHPYCSTSLYPLAAKEDACRLRCITELLHIAGLISTSTQAPREQSGTASSFFLSTHMHVPECRCSGLLYIAPGCFWARSAGSTVGSSLLCSTGTAWKCCCLEVTQTLHVAAWDQPARYQHTDVQGAKSQAAAAAGTMLAGCPGPS